MNLFIDTNVFLSFFHLTNDDLEEIHKLAVLLEKGDVILWLPFQVKDEFCRNRENKISEALKKLKEQKSKPQFPQICKDYEEYPKIRELRQEYDQVLSALITKVATDVENKTLKADEKISELFSKSKIIDSTDSIVSSAKERMILGNPPGKNNSYGDAINWEALLEHVPAGEGLYFVADDSDYFSVLNENKLKDFLEHEWCDKKKSEIIIYRRLSQFFKEHYPDIKLASELEKELAINLLVNSGCFSNTHLAVSKLKKYAEFNKSQANELAQAAVINNQVSWVICDPDVYEFFLSLYTNHQQTIAPELIQQLYEKLKVCYPAQDNA